MSLRTVPAAGEPFLRPSSSRAQVPDGWVAMPVGRWDGEQTKAVFDPDRHSVLVVVNAGADGPAGALRRDGWTCIAAEGDRRLMVGTRAAAARDALARHDALTLDRAPGRDALGR